MLLHSFTQYPSECLHNNPSTIYLTIPPLTVICFQFFTIENNFVINSFIPKFISINNTLKNES